jgi:FtsP/CotA-like multicopper oxidase with cupredoxin domain
VQSSYPESFERDVGYSDTEWRIAIVRAAGPHPIHIQGNSAKVQLGEGSLSLQWSPLPNRTIALLSMPRLAVRFTFKDVGPEARYAFMRVFDLMVQKGGG